MGWDSRGTIVFDNVSCTGNAATFNGGCFYGLGRSIFNDGASMLDNSAVNGGGIRELKVIAVSRCLVAVQLLPTAQDFATQYRAFNNRLQIPPQCER